MVAGIVFGVESPLRILNHVLNPDYLRARTITTTIDADGPPLDYYSLYCNQKSMVPKMSVHENHWNRLLTHIFSLEIARSEEALYIIDFCIDRRL